MKLGHSLVLDSCTCPTAYGRRKKTLHTFFWSCKLSHFSVRPSSLSPQIPPGISDLCVNQSASSWNTDDKTGLRLPRFPLGPQKPLKTLSLFIWTIDSEKHHLHLLTLLKIPQRNTHWWSVTNQTGWSVYTHTHTHWSTSDFNKPQTFFQAINNEFQPNRQCL